MDQNNEMQVLLNKNEAAKKYLANPLEKKRKTVEELLWNLSL